MKPFLTILTAMTMACLRLNTQETSLFGKTVVFSNQLNTSFDRKASTIERKLSWQAAKYHSCIQKEEAKLNKKLSEKDFMAAWQLFEETEEFYVRLYKAPGSMNKYTPAFSNRLDSPTSQKTRAIITQVMRSYGQPYCESSMIIKTAVHCKGVMEVKSAFGGCNRRGNQSYYLEHIQCRPINNAVSNNNNYG